MRIGMKYHDVRDPRRFGTCAYVGRDGIACVIAADGSRYFGRVKNWRRSPKPYRKQAKRKKKNKKKADPKPQVAVDPYARIPADLVDEVRKYAEATGLPPIVVLRELASSVVVGDRKPRKT